MSITTYATLRDAVAGTADQSWSHRGNMLTVFDTFLQLTEEQIYTGGSRSNGQRVDGLRVKELETRSTASLSTSSRFLELPDNFLEARRIELEYTDGNGDKVIYELKFVVPSELREIDYSSRPTRFTVTSQYEFDCTPDIAYTVEDQHYAKATAISSSNSTNTILTNYPSIYLYGCLANAAKWAHQIDKAIYYNELFLNAIENANSKDRWSRIGPAPQMIYHGSIA